jgi:hypothetical protein
VFNSPKIFFLFDCRKKGEKEENEGHEKQNRKGGERGFNSLYIDFQMCSNGFFFLFFFRKNGFKCLSSMYNYKNEKDPALV